MTLVTIALVSMAECDVLVSLAADAVGAKNVVDQLELPAPAEKPVSSN